MLKTPIQYLITKLVSAMEENEITFKIIGAAIKLHKEIGPGLLESAYREALAFDLMESGLHVIKEVPLPFLYKQIKQDVGYRIDLIVENKIILEIKSVEYIMPVHKSQILTYLKLSDLKLGLLINFNSRILKDGIYRVVNNF